MGTGTSKIDLFEQYGNIQDIEDSIHEVESSSRHVVALTSKRRTMSQAFKFARLGNAYNNRFNLLGDLEDSKKAFAALHKAVALTQDDTEERAAVIGVLGIAYSSRFERLGELQDVSSAIFMLQQAVDFTPPDDPTIPLLLGNLGCAFAGRLRRLEQTADISGALATLHQAIELTRADDLNLVAWLENLGTAYVFRFEQLGDSEDIDSAIAAYSRATEITQAAGSETAVMAMLASQYNSLGDAYRARFERLGELGDLHNSIASLQRSMELAPVEPIPLARTLTNVGNGYRTRFERLGNVEDIDTAISLLRRAVDSLPSGHPSVPPYLNNLAIAYQRRFERYGDIDDMKNQIDISQHAVDLVMDGHAHKPLWLHTLGNALRSRYERLGELADIERAINFLQRAVELTPDGHASAAAKLRSLGTALCILFERRGALGDIARGIDTLRQAAELTPDDSADKASGLNSLGGAFLRRFRRTGDLEDVDGAVAVLQRAVDLTPVGHADKPLSLNNLGNAFKDRYEHLDDPDDLEAAIDTMQRAVDLTPAGHANKADRLSNLGRAFQLRFHELRQLEDIEKAIVIIRSAVDLTPEGHSLQPSRLNNLGNTLRARYDYLRERGDIDEAISILQKGIGNTPNEHVLKPILLGNLGIAFQARFDGQQHLEDLDSSITSVRTAIGLMPSEDATKARWVLLLANAYRSRFRRLGTLPDFNAAFEAYEAATAPSFSSPFLRLSGTLEWAKLCTLAGSPCSAQQAYARFMELLPQKVWLGQNINRRFKELAHYGLGDSVNAAAATAIADGDFGRALEWLEEGRSVVWGQLLRLRTPLDALRAADPELADKLRDISHALQLAGDLSTAGVHADGGQDAVPHATKDEESRIHRAMAREYEDVLKQVRTLDGFEWFLRPKRLDTLARAAEHGLVIVVNVHQSRCDALVLCAASRIVAVPLPKFSYKLADKLRVRLAALITGGGIRSRGSAPSMPGRNSEDGSLASVLSCLWLYVVKPILEAIEGELWYAAIGRIPRIIWCATGPLAFLPLHAAGIYRSIDAVNVSDFVVSSYTPTLSSLLLEPSIPAPGNPTRNVLVVSQPQTPGQIPLPGTITEAAVVSRHFPHDAISPLNHTQATVAAVLAAMRRHSWIHLACHGIQDLGDPTKSAFALYDGQLTLAQLMGQSLAHAELAVLSACQTATGDATLPEEAVHLAAGMLAVGYRNVVGTMWSVRDRDAPVVADAFYSSLLSQQQDECVEGRAGTAADALHDAVICLRDAVGVQNFVRWVPFVHFGI